MPKTSGACLHDPLFPSPIQQVTSSVANAPRRRNRVHRLAAGPPSASGYGLNAREDGPCPENSSWRRTFTGKPLRGSSRRRAWISRVDPVRRTRSGSRRARRRSERDRSTRTQTRARSSGRRAAAAGATGSMGRSRRRRLSAAGGCTAQRSDLLHQAASSSRLSGARRSSLVPAGFAPHLELDRRRKKPVATRMTAATPPTLEIEFRLRKPSAVAV